jgi:squalene cyclase
LWWLGFSGEDRDVERGLDWLMANQEPNGLWKARYVSRGDKEIHLWTTVRVCRVLRRFHG